MEKTHYRKVFKSDHLGVADLEEMIEDKKKLIFTIKEVKQEHSTLVAGKKIDANIAYFKENIKPLVLNATNSKQVQKFANGSPFVEDWKDIVIELYADATVVMKGQKVGGVRIKPIQPKLTKPELTPNHPKWEAAKKSVKDGNSTKESIREHWLITDKNFDLLCG